MYTGVEIAIIGMGGRFPAAANLEQFWANIAAGHEAAEKLDEAALDALNVPAALRADPHFVPTRLPFAEMDAFDAGYFAFTPREATQLDPQQRVFLETAVATLEHAGYGKAAGLPVGVYAGSGANLYLLRELMPQIDWAQADIASLLGVMNGNDKDSLASRTAFELDLRGPAVSVQTACSTSLVAVHQACRALLAYECDMALAGGVFLNLLPQNGYRYQQGAILSADGHCRAFDAKASGTLLGSGCGLVMLKRLDEALADGDTIHAVIKGSAINNDGADKVGYTAPSVNGQAEVILAAQTFADVSPDSIGYVEAHGTGTVLGDPIEVAALTQAFRQGTDRKTYCAIGSLKTQIGHLDAAAGVAGLIRTVLALKHQTLPPSLNFDTPNPQIDFANSPFYVNTVAKPWPAGSTPRRAGVSSFGMGGTNAHVIVEEAPAPAAHVSDTRPQLLPVSACSEAALQAAQQNLASALANTDHALADIAHTLKLGRKAHNWRSVVLADTPAQAAQIWLDAHHPRKITGEARSDVKIAMLFPGQGAQHAGMGRTLYDSEPVYREVIDACCQQLQPLLDLDLRTLLHADADDDAAATLLQQTRYTQPALFVTSYALARLWQHYGVMPAALLGHSVGEYVAATLAGVFSLDNALRLIALRGRLLHETAEGAMLAVSLSEADIQPYLAAGVDLAAINAPGSCVLAGTAAAIAGCEEQLTKAGIASRRLQVGRAFHSRLTEPVLAAFRAAFDNICLQAPSIPFVSNISGTWMTPAEATNPDYWVRHIRAGVRFADGLTTLLQSHTLLLEAGVGDTLSTLARRHPQAASASIVASQCHPRQQDDNAQQWQLARARLWVAGAADSVLGSHTDTRRVPLPTYPFQRQRYRVEPPAAGQTVVPAQEHGLDNWFYRVDWQRQPLPAAGKIECPAHILLLGKPGALTDKLISHWQAQGAVVTLASQGEAFARLGEQHFSVRVAERDDLIALLQNVADVSHIVHSWSVHDTVPAADTALQDGFYSLLALTQAVDAANLGQLAITIIANQLEDITGSEPLCAEKAALYGPLKVIPQEYPSLTCRLVEVDHATLAQPAALLAGRLLQVMTTTDGPDRQYWRGQHVWHKNWQETALPAAVPTRLKKGGCYLITGGLGGIGLTLARYLAREWQARLVLLGRRTLPAEQEWDAHADDARIAAVRELRALGSEVLVLAADVADSHGLQSALAVAQERFGHIDGVVHAAGEAGGNIIDHLDKTICQQTLAAKQLGAANLLTSLAACPPDFVLLCSSISTLLGGIGKADYAAANAILDVQAQQAQRQGLKVIAAGWDGWKEVGMAANTDMPAHIGIRPDDGQQAFARLLASIDSHIMVSTTPLQPRLAEDLGELLQEAPQAKAHTTRHPRPALSQAYEAPQAGLEADLAELWSAFLGISPIGVHDHLFELGGDSLLAIQLLAKVRQQYGVDIHPAAFFKCPTVAELAWLTESRLLDAIENDTQPDGV